MTLLFFTFSSIFAKTSLGIRSPFRVGSRPEFFPLRRAVGLERQRMDSLIRHRLFERVIDDAMLLQQPFAFESRGHNNELPVVAAAGQVLGLNELHGHSLRYRLFNLLWGDHGGILPTR